MNFKVFHLLTFVFLVKKKKLIAIQKQLKLFSLLFAMERKKKSWLYEEELFEGERRGRRREKNECK